MSWDNPNFLERQRTKVDMAYFYFLLVFLKKITCVLDIILDILFGFTITRGTRSERDMAKERYEHSAHVVDVWFCANWSTVFRHSPNNFLFTHNSYIHPREILKDDKITLQGVTETHAYFTVSRPHKDVYDTNFCPFVFVAQLFEAQQLILLPNK